MNKDQLIVRLTTELYYLKHKIEDIRESLDGVKYKDLPLEDRDRLITAINLIDESPLFDQGE